MSAASLFLGPSRQVCPAPCKGSTYSILRSWKWRPLCINGASFRLKDKRKAGLIAASVKTAKR
jgi:hypothetical protein